jgi:hypothetical protein
MRFPDAFVVEAPPKDRKSEDRLVVEPTPLKNMISSVGMMTFRIVPHIMEIMKHVPNHQPE